MFLCHSCKKRIEEGEDQAIVGKHVCCIECSLRARVKELEYERGQLLNACKMMLGELGNGRYAGLQMDAGFWAAYDNMTFALTNMCEGY